MLENVNEGVSTFLNAGGLYVAPLEYQGYDDMVSFEVAVRDGHFAIITEDFERLTGCRPKSLRALLEQHQENILTAAARINPQPPVEAMKDVRNA